MVLIALTGDVFAKPHQQTRRHSEAKVWRYTPAARVFFIVNVIVVATFLVVSL